MKKPPPINCFSAVGTNRAISVPVVEGASSGIYKFTGNNWNGVDK